MFIICILKFEHIANSKYQCSEWFWINKINSKNIYDSLLIYYCIKFKWFKSKIGIWICD